jgi:NADH-quinone oxidoreductase subunit I
MWGTGFFKGMWVTMKNMLRGPITLQYPEQREELPERARWALQPKYDAEGKPKCTACEICVRACPDGIITLDYHKDDQGGKHIDSYRYEVGACMFCGLCTEACPFDAIEMGKDYELATPDPKCLYRTLLKDVPAAGRKKAEPKPAPAAEPKPSEDAGAEKPTAPASSPGDHPEGGDRDAG